MTVARGILFCGGGTGGHIMPGLSVAEAGAKRGLAASAWIGDPERLEARLVPASGISLLPWGLSRPRVKDPRWLLQALRRAWGCWKSMRAHPPKAVVALGGYASLLPGILAPFLRRPLVVMEQNALPGKTNQLLARFARASVVQFGIARSRMRRSQLLGNPVRNFPAKTRGADENLTLLIMGGSLAAKTLNDLGVEMAPGLAAVANLKIIHLAGGEDADRVRSAYEAAGVNADVRGFENDMGSVYAQTDIALCRAGATTVSELCSAGIGALYIPLPWAADDHQTWNARAVERLGGARVIPQSELDAQSLAADIGSLGKDRKAVQAMGEAAQQLARPRAADDVIDLIMEVIEERS